MREEGKGDEDKGVVGKNRKKGVRENRKEKNKRRMRRERVQKIEV